MKRILGVFLLMAGLLALGVEPLHQWNFAKQRDKVIRDEGTAKLKWNYTNHLVESDSIRCGDGSYRFIVCPRVKNEWQSMTVDVQFKLDSALDKKSRALFSYENSAWRQRYLIFRFNRSNQLEVEIAQVKGSVTEKKFSMSSDVLQLEPGSWHNARFTLASGGDGQIWLDAKQVASKKGALCVGDLDYTTAQWYPLVCFGVDPANPTQKRDFLRGSIRSLRLWDSVVEPNPLFDAPMKDSGERDFSHVLVATGGDAEWTCPFMVQDVEGAAAGSYVMADEKFRRTAGKAKASIAGNDLVVTYQCAIAPGVDPKKVPGGGVWSGEAVEFFFRPDKAQPGYYHYGAGINGATYVARMTAPRNAAPGFVSQAKIDVSDTPDCWTAVFRIPLAEIGLVAKDGQAYTCNFTRSGPAAGGLQTWGALGDDFHHPDAFPVMVVGSRKEFFKNKLSAAREKLAMLNAGATELAKKAEGMLSELEKVIAANGESRDWYRRIDSSFGNLENLFTSIALEGKPFVVWEPEDAYGNNLGISMLSKPVAKLAITMPRNSTARRGLVFTNMTDKPFFGQIKCFEKWPLQSGGKTFCQEPWNEFLAGVRFSEGLPIMDSAMNILYDPVAPLAMGTIVRAAANGTVPLWLEVSSKGLKAGTYTGVIVVKGDYPGFGNQTIPLEVKVLSANPEDYPCINMNFTYMNGKGGHPNQEKFLSARGINTIFAANPDYPEIMDDGTIGPVGYEKSDAALRRSFANGYDVKTCHLIYYLTMERKWCMLHNGKVRHPYGTPQFEKAFKLFIQDMVKHLEDTFGLQREQIIFYPCDEPGGDWNDPQSTMSIAWNAGNWLKEAAPGTHRFIDPHPFGASRKKLNAETMDKIFGVYDIIMLYRPANTQPDVIAAARAHNCAIWTYGILEKTVHASVYRRFFWQNLKDGLGSTAAFWHVESHAGGDGFDSFDFNGYHSTSRTDYGTVYTDWNLGTILSGRRFDAWCDGYTDYRLAHLCIAAAEKRADKDAVLKKLQGIFEKGAEGTIPDMENCRLELLDIYERLMTTAK